MYTHTDFHFIFSNTESSFTSFWNNTRCKSNAHCSCIINSFLSYTSNFV